MKEKIKLVLQKTLGIENYLLLFSLIKIFLLRFDKMERDFFIFLNFLKLHQRPGVILDIGANIGLMTYHLSQAFPNQILHAFEPVPYNLITLKKIIKIFRLRNVVIHECALGESSGQVNMVLPKINDVFWPGLSHIIHHTIPNHSGTEYSVPMEKLDNLDLGPIFAIKMDVENFESFVLAGGQESIAKYQPYIYTELWEAGTNRSRALQLMEKLNYSVHVVSANQIVPYNSTIHTTQNFLFLPL